MSVLDLTVDTSYRSDDPKVLMALNTVFFSEECSTCLSHPYRYLFFWCSDLMNAFAAHARQAAVTLQNRSPSSFCHLFLNKAVCSLERLYIKKSRTYLMTVPNGRCTPVSWDIVFYQLLQPIRLHPIGVSAF